VLARHGAVSAAVVEQMAIGALRASGADLAVAVSGVAGPDAARSTSRWVWCSSPCYAAGVRRKSRSNTTGRSRAVRGAAVDRALQLIARPH